MWFLWFAVSSIGLWIALVNLFAAVMHAKAIIDRGEKLHWFFEVPLALGGLVGVVLDVAFNYAFGWAIYADKAILRGPTFTARTRYWKTQPGWRGDRARWWCAQMVKFDKTHCGHDDEETA